MLTQFTSRIAATAGLAVLAAGALAATPAQADAAPAPAVLAKGLVAPLSVAVNGDNVVYFSGSFTGQLFRMVPGKDPKVVYSSKNVQEIEGISTKGKATYFIADTKLMRRSSDGFVAKVADIGAYETAHNPDSDTAYGLVDGTSQDCIDAWPTGDDFPPAQYTGAQNLETHPYATAVDGGTVYVADAAGNSILKVNSAGVVSTVAVLPAVPVTITEDMATQLGLPDACVGAVYRFEGVPTDVELGFNDLLYVSSLPGGEIPGEGAVLAVDPTDGSVNTVARGFSGATGVAVSGEGTIYVSQLFAGEVTEIPLGGDPVTFAHVKNPSAVEVKGNRLYVTSNVLSGQEPGTQPNAKVLRYQR